MAEHIAEMSKGVIRFIVKTDDTLEQELRMNIAFYEYEEKNRTIKKTGVTKMTSP